MEKGKGKRGSPSESPEAAPVKKKCSSDYPIQHPSAMGTWTLDIDPATLSLIADKSSFQNFKANTLSAVTDVPPICLGQVRSFLWQMVQGIQKFHAQGLCPERISPECICVAGNQAHMLGEKVPYSLEKAKDNYQALHSLILEHFLAETQVKDLPPTVSHFLGLLMSENPVAQAGLIARHYCIMSPRARINFANNLFLCPSTLSDEERTKFYDRLDSISMVGGWRVPSFEEIPFLMDMYKSGKYEHDCPATKMFWLLKFYRECHNHVGLEARTDWEVKPLGLKEWRKNAAQLNNKTERQINKQIKRCFDKGNDEPKMSQDELVDLLLTIFPTFLTQVQAVMSETHFLELLCVDPRDRFPSLISV